MIKNITPTRSTAAALAYFVDNGFTGDYLTELAHNVTLGNAEAIVSVVNVLDKFRLMLDTIEESHDNPKDARRVTYSNADDYRLMPVDVSSL